VLPPTGSNELFKIFEGTASTEIQKCHFEKKTDPTEKKKGKKNFNYFIF